MLSIQEQWSNLHEPLKNRTYLGKKLFLCFFGHWFSFAQKQTVMWKTASIRDGIYFLVFAHVWQSFANVCDHMQWFYGNCRTLKCLVLNLALLPVLRLQLMCVTKKIKETLAQSTGYKMSGRLCQFTKLKNK